MLFCFFLFFCFVLFCLFFLKLYKYLLGYIHKNLWEN